MTLQEFIAKWTGKPVDTDGAIPNQCMDLMHQYLIDVLGLPTTDLGAPAAKDVFDNFDKEGGHEFFTRIVYQPGLLPQPGDIMFWGNQVGVYGHVAILLRKTGNQFFSFDANWPLKSLPHEQLHNYTGVIGWITPKGNMSQVQLDRLAYLEKFFTEIIPAQKAFKTADSDTVYITLALKSMDVLDYLGQKGAPVEVVDKDQLVF